MFLIAFVLYLWPELINLCCSMMYTKSVDSPASVRPRMPNLEEMDRNTAAVADENPHQPPLRSSLMDSTRLDFWSKMGQWHQQHIISPKPAPILKVSPQTKYRTITICKLHV